MTSYSYRGKKRIWKQRDDDENKRICGAVKENPSDKPALTPEPPAGGVNAKSDADSEKWDLKRLITLLRLYGSHRCLWDSRDADNRNYKLRQAALIDIATAIGDGVTRHQVLRKINVLRATYRYEKRRIKQRIHKGIGAKTKLKWFALADAFLRNVPRGDKSKKSQTAESDSDLEDTVVFVIDPETLIPIDECAEDHGLTPKQEPAYKGYEENPMEPQRVSYKSRDNPFDSLTFVQLLKEHPVLWLKDSNQLKAPDKMPALKAIANEMNYPIGVILKRVTLFNRLVESARQKQLESPGYKPNYPWWQLAESFIFGDYVDWAKPRSPEPIQIVKCEPIDEETPRSDSYLDVNPIPSVAPPSVKTLEHAVDVLFNKDDCSEFLQPKIICSIPESEDLLQDKWSLKHSVKFLRLYGSHSCLWDRNDPDYHSRPMRTAALEDIAAAMGNGLDVKFVASKIRIFRVTYMQQRKRMLEAVRRNENPEFKLRWFPLADSFLRPHIGLRSIKDPSQEIPQFDYQYVYTYLNLIDPELLTDFEGKGTQNTIAIGRGWDAENE